MPWEATGKKPGKRPTKQNKVALTLLYGVGIPGVKKVGAGKLIVTIHPLSQHLRLTGVQIKEALQTLESWGVLEELHIERTYCIVTFRESSIFNNE